MSSPSLFDWAAEAIERNSSWSRIEARGVLRLTLQQVGLEARTLTAKELAELLRGALAKDLEARGIREADAICKKLLAELLASQPGAVSAGETAAAAPAPAALPSTFDWVADNIDVRTQMGRMQARGTLRLALKEAGLSPEELTRQQASAVIGQLMPRFLKSRAVAGADAVCAAIVADLATAELVEPASANESPEEIFRRLGSRTPRG